MKKKSYLILFLIIFFCSHTFGQSISGGCDCDLLCVDGTGAISYPCTLSGIVYATGDECVANPDTGCGGVPINSNSWTLIIAGVSILLVGAVLTRKLRS